MSGLDGFVSPLPATVVEQLGRVCVMRPNGSLSTMTEDHASAESTTDSGATVGSLIGWIALYTVVRLGLVVVIAAAIIGIALLFGVKVPILVAAAFGVLIALPLGLVLFKGLRDKVNQQIAAVDADRAARRSDLHSRLRGDDEKD